MEEPAESLKVCQSLLELYAGTDFSSLENPQQGADALGLVRAKIVELKEQIKRKQIETELKREVEAKAAAEADK